MPPLTMMIKPASSACNMRCAYCFYADEAARRSVACHGRMSEETLEILLRRAFAYAEGSVSIAFQGGEPTLAGKAFFRRFLQLEEQYNARRLPVTNAVQTNGLLLDDEWADIFREGNFLVGVSVDGTRALHDGLRRDTEGAGTYDRVMSGLRLLRQRKIPYNILTVVTEPMARQGQAVFRALEQHRYLQFIPCLDDLEGTKTPFSLSGESYGRFLIDTFALYEKAIYARRPVSVRTFDNWLGMLLGYPPESCNLSGRCAGYYLFEADGTAYPCDFYVLDKWRLGNIRDMSFYQLAASPIAREFREEGSRVSEHCRTCRYHSLCRGGCRRDREPVEAGQNRLCPGLRMLFDACLGRMEKLAVWQREHGARLE